MPLSTSNRHRTNHAPLGVGTRPERTPNSSEQRGVGDVGRVGLMGLEARREFGGLIEDLIHGSGHGHQVDAWGLQVTLWSSETYGRCSAPSLDAPPQRGCPDGLALADDNLPEGSDGWRNVPELQRQESEPLVHKHYGDSFEATALPRKMACASLSP